jgi:hypothetical protein
MTFSVLSGKSFLDIFLKTTEQEWSQDLVQTTNDENLFFFGKFHLVLATSVREGCVEPFVERLDRFEDGWKDEVEKSPQFRKVILQRCTSENETVSGE